MLKSTICRMALCALLVPGVASADTPLSAEDHAKIGIAAAADFPGYASLCNLDARMRNVNVPRDRKAQAGGQKRGSGGGSGQRLVAGPLPPTRVFDNLYFLGRHSVTAWLYGTEDGYILIDGLNNDEEAEKYILGGMRELGLDPKAIKHILVTHGHGDHYGGADYVAETLGLEVTMTEPDWQLVARIGTHPRFGPPPKRGIAVEDGQVLEFGTSQLTVHMSPGHTPGTVSPIFEVSDNGARHTVMLWGGTGFNFGPHGPTFLEYAKSARKMRKLAAQAGVAVFLSGHPRRDGTGDLLSQLGTREDGDSHPFVRGQEGYALFTTLEHCALAQAARFEKAVSAQPDN
jgi:metallo-beta-lactamase class B